MSQGLRLDQHVKVWSMLLFHLVRVTGTTHLSSSPLHRLQLVQPVQLDLFDFPKPYSSPEVFWSGVGCPSSSSRLHFCALNTVDTFKEQLKTSLFK